MSPKIQAVVEFMKANLNRELSLNEPAQSANVSRSHLCYLFKTQTSVSPAQYLKSMRMQKARAFGNHASKPQTDYSRGRIEGRESFHARLQEGIRPYPIPISSKPFQSCNERLMTYARS